jgi:hypothetical protein
MEQAFNDLSPPSPGKMMPLEEEHDDHSADSISGSPKKGKKKRDSSALRKAPQAPKRFKSSYICFFMAKQPDIKGELGNKATVTEISKRSAEMWYVLLFEHTAKIDNVLTTLVLYLLFRRNLPTDERAHWDDVAAKDKQRYMVEKASYTGPWQVPWKRAKKDPSAPKRPMSAFLYFSQGRRKKLKDKNPNLKNTEVSRLLGELWRSASEEEKRPHVDQEKKEREKYKIAIAEWRKEYEKKKEDQRKQQAEQATQWAQQYNPEGGEAPTPQIQQYSQPAYMPPPPGYAPYPPPHYYCKYSILTNSFRLLHLCLTTVRVSHSLPQLLIHHPRHTSIPQMANSL